MACVSAERRDKSRLAMDEIIREMPRDGPSDDLYFDYLMIINQRPRFRDVVEWEDVRCTLFNNLHEADLVIYRFAKDLTREVYAISATFDKLEDVAAMMKLKLKLKAVGAGYLEFDKAHRGDYVGTDNPKCAFRSKERQQIMQQMLRNPSHAVGSKVRGADVNRFMSQQINLIADLFPTHSVEALHDLDHKWVTFRSFGQPLSDVRDYFGERIAFYFAWLECYMSALVVPAVLGPLLGIYQIVVGADNVLMPVWGFFLCIWTSVFVKYWNRKNQVLLLEWSVSERLHDDFVRPGRVEGLVKINRVRKIVTLLMSIGSLASVVGLLFLYWRISAPFGLIMGSDPHDLPRVIVVSIPCAVVVYAANVFEFILVSNIVNRFENHRTEKAFQRHLVFKSFPLMAANYFVLPIYIAFVERDFFRLSVFAGTYFLAHQVLNLAVRFAFVVFTSLIKRRNDRNAFSLLRLPDENESQEQLFMRELGRTRTTNATLEFMQMMLQLGAIALVGVAFPWMPLIAIGVNYLRVRFDALLLTRFTQRPEADVAEGIGTWGPVQDIISYTGAIVTSLVVALTSSQFMNVYLKLLPMDYVRSSNIWIFLIAEHAVFVLKFALAYLVSDVPGPVLNELKRRRYREEQARAEVTFEHKPTTIDR
eukprot:TRINITY_DN2738_c0_g1_i6.p1 TRINITY_DN2738_c0_g1~~TRINITY_DN2738_c0_g1_i6.p1  ORF type:complete len:648 (+),score=74.62 TRINITY_DN2738_c0_g1_i6:144-2087(+)